MNHPSLYGTRFYLKTAVVKAEGTIIRKGGLVTSGKVIAEQSLGFWVSMFDVHHYRLIGGAVIHIFPDKPATVNRSIISQKLAGIREFRNRIYHNEPICFIGNEIDFAHVHQIRREIYSMLSWMDVKLVDYVDYFDAVDAKIDMVNNL